MLQLRWLSIVLVSVLLLSCAWLDDFISSGDSTAFSCPISPPEMDPPAPHTSVAPSGSFPVWIPTRGSLFTSSLLISPPPYPGYRTKALLWFDTSIEGNVTLTGQTLDGPGIILFGGVATDSTYETPPQESFLIEDAHVPDILHNPPGFAGKYFGWYVSGPGCYQITATTAANDGTAYTTAIVFEVTDE